MIFNPETKGFQTISTHPNDNWTDDKTLLVIPDDSELAARITANYPCFNCVFDKEGMLIDVTPTPQSPPTPQPTPQEDADAMMVDHEYRLTLLELGVTDDAV